MMDYRRLVIELIGKEPIINEKEKADTYSWSSYGRKGIKKDFNWSQNKLVFKIALNELNKVIERCIKLNRVLVPNPKDKTIVNKYWVKETTRDCDSSWESGWEKVETTLLSLCDLDNTALITARGHFDRRGRCLAIYNPKEETLEITDKVYLVAEANKEKYLNHPLIISPDCEGYNSPSQYADADEDVKIHNPFEIKTKFIKRN